MNFLQVTEKELRRHLARDREKLRSTEQKFRESKTENERLQIQLAQHPLVANDMPYHAKWEALRAELGTKKVTFI